MSTKRLYLALQATEELAKTSGLDTRLAILTNGSYAGIVLRRVYGLPKDTGLKVYKELMASLGVVFGSRPNFIVYVKTSYDLNHRFSGREYREARETLHRARNLFYLPGEEAQLVQVPLTSMDVEAMGRDKTPYWWGL